LPSINQNESHLEIDAILGNPFFTMTFLFLDPCARDVLERLDRASFSFLGGILEAFVRAGDDFRDSARRRRGLRRVGSGDY
jgi:hypothetical protein